MKKKGFIAAFISCIFFISCKDCVTCTSGGENVEICHQSGATYTDNEGNTISWEEYKATVLPGCE